MGEERLYLLFSDRHPEIARHGPLAIVEFCTHWVERKVAQLENLLESAEDDYECAVASFIDDYMFHHKRSVLALAKNAALVERMRGGSALWGKHNDRRKAGKLLRLYKTRKSCWESRKWNMIKRGNYT